MPAFPVIDTPTWSAPSTQLITNHLNVQHLRLLMGMSMGCMHAWMWAEDYPRIMEGTMPLACLPAEIAGRNRMWRKTAHERHHPRSRLRWRRLQEASRAALPRLTRSSRSWVAIQSSANSNIPPALRLKNNGPGRPTHSRRRRQRHRLRARLFARLQSASEAVDHPITAARAINFADDLINPPELGNPRIGDQRSPERTRNPHPRRPNTHGHGTHTSAEVWKSHLQEFLRETATSQ